jgi:hypothetical protein
MIHFLKQLQVKVVFDHYKQHLDSLDIQEEVEQDLMYLTFLLAYMQYVTVFDHAVEFHSKFQNYFCETRI